MIRLLQVLLAGCLLAAALPAAADAPARRAGKARPSAPPPAGGVSPIRRVRDALAELGFAFVPDGEDGNALSLVVREREVFRGDIRFRLAYDPPRDLLQAQGVLSDEDLVRENIPRAFAFASRRQLGTFYPKIMVETNVPGGAIVTEWNWQPLSRIPDEALERNLAVFVSSSVAAFREAIEENIYPVSLAVPAEEDAGEPAADPLDAVFR